MQLYTALALGYLTMTATRFPSTSHADKSIFPISTVKIVNFSDDTITITISSESDDALKIVVPPF